MKVMGLYVYNNHSVSALEIKMLKRLDIFQVIQTYVVSLQTVWYDLSLHSGHP